MGDLAQGRLTGRPHLAVAETYAEMAPPERQRRLQVAGRVAAAVAGQAAGSPGGVIEQARFLASR
jgi:hypothetical protein